MRDSSELIREPTGSLAEVFKSHTGVFVTLDVRGTTTVGDHGRQDSVNS